MFEEAKRMMELRKRIRLASLNDKADKTSQWIAEIFLDIPNENGETTRVATIPFSIRDDVRDLKRALKKSKSPLKVREHQVKMDGDWVV